MMFKKGLGICSGLAGESGFSYIEPMKVKVLFFASFRDIAGCKEKDWEIPEGVTVGDLKDRVMTAFAGLGPLSNSLAVAVNTEYSDDSTVLSDGDEVALIPPVSGG